VRNAVARLGVDIWFAIASSPDPRLDIIRDTYYVYYATDDFAAGADLFGIDKRALARDESRQAAGADLIVAVSATLADKWRGGSRPIVVMPNGCDEALAERMHEVTPAPDVTLEPPVVGLVGQISSRVSLDLIEAVSDGGTSLLLVGPIDPTFDNERVGRLLARSNVQWVGRQPLEALPAYYRHMDVGITPYVLDTFNRASVPLKTLEYLSAGLLVVTTPLPGAEWIPETLVLRAGTAAEFADAVRSTLRSTAANDLASRRMAFVHDNSWTMRARQLVTEVERRTAAGSDSA